MDPYSERTARSKGKTRWRWCAWRASIWCWLIQSTPLLLQDLCNLIHMQNSSAQSCRARKHTRNLQNHVLLMPQVLAIRKPLPNIFFLNLVFLYTKLLVFLFFFFFKQNRTKHFILPNGTESFMWDLFSQCCFRTYTLFFFFPDKYSITASSHFQ